MAKDNILMENARIVFRNFAGEESRFNRKGDRNFCVILDPEFGEQLSRDGWNVKVLQGREGEDDKLYLQVSVGFKGKPPRLVMITSRGRTDLDEDSVELLDWADILVADLIIRPYNWDVSGKTGVKAYVKSLFVTIQEDELELKYADVQEISKSEAIREALGDDEDGR